MKTKKQFKFFTIFEYEKEEDYLRDMHKRGWKFVKVTGLGVYHFEECEPQDVVYQLDYNREGLEHKEEYVKMFGDCGWEYIQDYAGFSYFRKPADLMNGDEEIFCDDESRLQMMERIYKGRLLPLGILFFACLLPQFFLNLLSFGNYTATVVLGMVIGLYIGIFAAFAIKYFRYKHRGGRK